MKLNSFVLYGILCFFLTFCTAGIITLRNINQTNDYQLFTITKIHRNTQLHFENPIRSNASFSFKASENNLGIIMIPIDQKKRIPSQELSFTIVEKGEPHVLFGQTVKEDRVFYSNHYLFGFPPIAQSKNKSYLVTIKSTDSKKPLPLFQNNRFIISKHSFSGIKNSLSVNALFSYGVKKFISYISMLQKHQIVALFLFPFLYVLLLLTHRNEGKNDIDLKNIWYIFKRKCTSREALVLTVCIYCFIFSFYASRSSTPQILKLFLSFPLLILLILVFTKKQIAACISYFKENKLLVYVLGFFLGLELLFIHDYPVWDAAANFRSLVTASQRLSPFFINFFDLLNWYGHPVHGYGSYMSIGQFFMPGSVEMMHVQNIILGIVTLLAFYEILKTHLSIKTTISALTTLLFAISPLFIALSNSTNLDYPALCFFVIALACLMGGNFLLFSFFSTMGVFSKEISLFLFSQLLLSYLLVYGKRNKIIHFISASVPFVLFAVYLYVSGGRMWEANYYLEPRRPFLLDGRLIFTRFFEITILNSNWILVLIIFFGSVYLFVTNNKKELFNRRMLVVLLTFLMFLCFILPYNTFTHPRYIGATLPFIFIFFAFSFDRIPIKPRLKYLFLIGMGIFLLVQNFKTIDPVSKLVFGTYKWNNHTFLAIGNTMQSRCDSMIYNMQHVQIERLYNQFTDEEKPKPNTVLFTNMSKKTFQSGGNWLIQYSIPIDYLTKKRTYVPRISVYAVATYPLEDWETAPIEGDIYYLKLPWIPSENDRHNQEIIRTNFRVEKMGRVESKGYSIDYLKLKKEQ